MRLARSTARVKVPATSGNLGPGFDSLGIAHSLWDSVAVRLVTGKSHVTIHGAGKGALPTDESHLIVKVIRRTLELAGLPQSGIELMCRNSIPQGRGLGSSAAAVVAGIELVRGLIDTPEALTPEVMLEIATEFEGHPDNAAPAIYGGATVSWMEKGTPRAVGLPVSDQLRMTLLVPQVELLTATARSVLPQTVPHVDAAFNAARSAMMVVALAGNFDVMMEATEDKLHQNYRADAMPASAQVLRALREAGWPAVVSGAGPSLLVFDTLDQTTSRMLEERGFTSIPSTCGEGAHILAD